MTPERRFLEHLDLLLRNGRIPAARFLIGDRLATISGPSSGPPCGCLLLTHRSERASHGEG